MNTSRQSVWNLGSPCSPPQLPVWSVFIMGNACCTGQNEHQNMQRAQVWILFLIHPLTWCVVLRQSLSQREPWYSHLEKGVVGLWGLSSTDWSSERRLSHLKREGLLLACSSQHWSSCLLLLPQKAEVSGWTWYPPASQQEQELTYVPFLLGTW